MSKKPSRKPTPLTLEFRALLHDYMIERNNGRMPYTSTTSEAYRERHDRLVDLSALEGHHPSPAVIASVCRTVYDDIKADSKQGFSPEEVIERWDFSILLSLSDFYKSVNMASHKDFLSEKPLPPNNNQDTK